MAKTAWKHYEEQTRDLSRMITEMNTLDKAFVDSLMCQQTVERRKGAKLFDLQDCVILVYQRFATACIELRWHGLSALVGQANSTALDAAAAADFVGRVDREQWPRQMRDLAKPLAAMVCSHEATSLKLGGVTTVLNTLAEKMEEQNELVILYIQELKAQTTGHFSKNSLARFVQCINRSADGDVQYDTTFGEPQFHIFFCIITCVSMFVFRCCMHMYNYNLYCV